MMLELIGTISMLLSVLGVVLNNRRLIACFPIWLVSNTLSLAIHWQSGIWSLTVRDAVFILLAVDGWRLWKKKK